MSRYRIKFLGNTGEPLHISYPTLARAKQAVKRWKKVQGKFIAAERFLNDKGKRTTIRLSRFEY